MADKLKWGIIGAGRIAGAFATGVALCETGAMLAVGSRDKGKAEAFGRKYDVPRCYGTHLDIYQVVSGVIAFLPWQGGEVEDTRLVCRGGRASRRDVSFVVARAD